MSTCPVVWKTIIYTSIFSTNTEYYNSRIEVFSFHNSQHHPFASLIHCAHIQCIFTLSCFTFSSFCWQTMEWPWNRLKCSPLRRHFKTTHFCNDAVPHKRPHTSRSSSQPRGQLHVQLPLRVEQRWRVRGLRRQDITLTGFYVKGEKKEKTLARYIRQLFSEKESLSPTVITLTETTHLRMTFYGLVCLPLSLVTWWNHMFPDSSRNHPAELTSSAVVTWGFIHFIVAICGLLGETLIMETLILL